MNSCLSSLLTWIPTGATLNYAPIMIGGISIISLLGWCLPKWGGRHWFKGPQKTITEEEINEATILGEVDTQKV